LGGTWAGSVLYVFNDAKQGISPTGVPLIDSTGKLYGATSSNQTYSTIFMLTPTPVGHWKHDVIHRFNGRDGAQPNGILSFDAQGNLYGTTYYGGKSNIGTVFRLSQVEGHVQANHFSFDITNGEYPLSGVIFDQAGNLYGTTDEGGTPGYGVVYEITP